MTTLVLDASVMVKWLFADRSGESHVIQALKILTAIRESRVSVIQPPHWLAEVAAVTVRLEARRAKEAVALLHALEFPIVATTDVYQQACELAAALDQHLFDTLYHAVALTEPGATLITADERYYRKAHQIGKVVRLKDCEGMT